MLLISGLSNYCYHKPRRMDRVEKVMVVPIPCFTQPSTPVPRKNFGVETIQASWQHHGYKVAIQVTNWTHHGVI